MSLLQQRMSALAVASTVVFLMAAAPNDVGPEVTSNTLRGSPQAMRLLVTEPAAAVDALQGKFRLDARLIGRTPTLDFILTKNSFDVLLTSDFLYLSAQSVVGPQQWCAAAVITDGTYYWKWFMDGVRLSGYDNEPVMEAWTGTGYHEYTWRVDVYSDAQMQGWSYSGYSAQTVLVDPYETSTCLSG